VDLTGKSRKEIGTLGEKVAAEYLRRRGFVVTDRNVARKTGELDLIAREGETMHFVEVKTIVSEEFPSETSTTKGAPQDEYDPSVNLHEAKIRKVARTAEWYVMEKGWEGEWQVDGCLVWLRRRDGIARVQYLPQIL
jgi:putative endonuclease